MNIDRTPLANSLLDELLSEGIVSLAELERTLFTWLMRLGCLVEKLLFERLDAMVTADALANGWRFKAYPGQKRRR